MVLGELTPAGRKLMQELFPEFNQQEQFVAGAVPTDKQDELAKALRQITANIEKND